MTQARNLRLLHVAGVLVLAACQPPLPAALPACVEGPPTGRWCWARGAPLAVSGDRDLGTVFAIGAEGAFFRWEAGAWVPAPVPTSRTLVSGWVGSASNAWVSDEQGSAWHFDGATWSEAPAGVPIARVLGSPDGAVWAVTEGGAVAHGVASGAELWRRDGSTWVRAMEPSAYCLGGDYLLGSDGSPWSAGLTCDADGVVSAVEVRRWNGSAWQPVGAPIPQQGWFPTLTRLDQTISVRATGHFTWDGTAWLASSPAGGGYPQGLPLDVTGLEDGVGWSVVPRALGCEGAFRLDATQAWCFGNGRIFASRGAGWASTLPDAFAQTLGADRWDTLPPALWAGGDVRRAWGSGPTDVYRIPAIGLAAASIPEHYDGTRWTPALDVRAVDVHGTGPNDVWFATEAGLVHFDGRSFVTRPVPAELADGPLTAVYAPGGGVVLGLTDAALLAYDGSWRVSHRAPRGWRILAVAGSGPTDLWLVQHLWGRNDTTELLHHDGTAWTRVEVSPLSWFGGASLATRGSQTWLASANSVRRLGVAGHGSPVPVNTLRVATSLWIGPDSLWLLSDTVARRRGLPE